MSDPLEPWESALTGERYVIEGRWTYHHPYIVDDLRPDIKKTRQTIEQYLKLKIKELEKENEELKAKLEQTVKLSNENSEEYESRVQQLEKENEELKAEAKRLWSLLDDISTYGDMYKPERTEYVKAVDKKCAEREGMIYSDGYKLYIREPVAHLSYDWTVACQECEHESDPSQTKREAILRWNSINENEK